LTNEGRIDFIQSLDVMDNAHPMYAYMLGEVRAQVNNTWNTLEPLPEQLTNILFLKYRKTGGLWVGTESGLYLYRVTTSLWNYWKKPETSRSNKVTDFLSTTDGSFWITTDEGLEIRRKNRPVEYITKIENKELYALTGLAEDANGNIWISSGASFEGAYRWNGTRWKYFGQREGLFGFIHKIKKDKKNRLWFLGMARYFADERTEPGAFLYENEKFIQWSTKQGLINNRVYAFVEGNDGTFWFGTNGGISRWKEGVWKHWTMSEGLKLNRTFTIALDSQNTLWFSDQMTGLGYLKDETPGYYTVEDGLISDAIWEINIDSLQRIWIATANGLSCFDNGIWSRFDASSGLNPLRLWPLLPLGNKLYVGTMGGGTAILNLDRVNSLPPMAVIEQSSYVNNSIHFRWNAYSHWGELPSNSIETRYHLDNDSWSKWSMDHQYVFGELKPGEHTFVVQAKGLFGKYSEAGNSYTFHVDSPYYLKPLFYIPMLTLAAGLFILGFVYNVRKRKQDKLLRLSEERYRGVVQDQAEYIVRITPEGKLLFVNEAFCRLTNQPSGDLLGNNLCEVVFSSIKKIVQHHIEAMKVLKPENPTSGLELEVLFPTGEIRWQSWIDRALFDSNGTLIEIQSVGRDITKQKIAELGLYRREAILEALSFATEHFMLGSSFEKSVEKFLQRLGEATEVDRVYIFANHQDADGTLLTSQRYEWVSGDTKPEIDNPDLQNIPCLSPVFQRWYNILSGGRYLYGNVSDFPQAEREVLEPQNILSVCVVPILINQQLWGFIGFDDCATQRNWSFAELEALKSAANLFGSAIERKEREKTVHMLASAIKSITECVTITDTENTILFVNDAFLKTYGYQSSEVIGQHIGIVRSEKTIPPTSFIIETTKESGWHGELLNRKKDGTEFPVYLSTSVVRDEAGEQIALIGVALDISQQKLIEKRLEEQAALLDITTDA
ncbi:MAG: PAS domain S-box protein, partial [Ignavibacteriae bacterium]|nr:PAS domain S-box protein [Ignavibacteriota bacterium]